MSPRLCRDCGVADWQPCQCVREAELEDNGLDPAVNPYQAAERRRPQTIYFDADGHSITPTREDHTPCPTLPTAASTWTNATPPGATSDPAPTEPF